MKFLSNTYGQFACIVAGGLIYALGMNVFIIPQDLYSGGAVGFAQLLEIFAVKLLHVDGGNVYGVIYIMINVPLLFVAYKALGRSFFFKTLFGAGSVSLFIAVIPIANKLQIDTLTSLLMGGIVTGVGVGAILLAGGSGGGLDIIAVWVTRKYRDVSVGKFSLYFNILLYISLLLLSDTKTIIHSLIYMFIFTIVLDKCHFQNINVRMMVFSKVPGIDQAIIEKTGRGVTKWKGTGSYNGDEMIAMVSCINKYEIGEFESIVHQIDSQAFIIQDENVRIHGNFEKRL